MQRLGGGEENDRASQGKTFKVRSRVKTPANSLASGPTKKQAVQQRKQAAQQRKQAAQQRKQRLNSETDGST